MQTDIYTFAVRRLDGSETTLNDWRGQVLLVVNTASECGFTPQYAGLQALQQRYAAQGFAVLGFPCNQFGGQEPGDSAQIGQFCEQNYGVTFPLFEKIAVNGRNVHPLYKHLKAAAKGILGSRAIKWNFTKFLINRQGVVIKRYAPHVKPESLQADIEALL